MKPLISFCLLAYNQESYIREAIRSALAQTYPNLEIIVSDDGSTDRTGEFIKEELASYTGPHKICCNVNQKNMGLAAHVSKVFNNLATGDFFVILGGDDYSEPNHVSRAVETIQQLKGANLVDFSGRVVDSNGQWIRDDVLEEKLKQWTLDDYLKMSEPLRTFAPGRIFSRQFWLKFGEIGSDCPTEDTVLVLRALMCGSIYRSSEILVNYRRHESNISSHENLRRIGLRTIIDQYYRDLQTAEQLGVLSSSNARLIRNRIRAWSILRWIKLTIPRRFLLRDCSRFASSLVKSLYQTYLRMNKV